MSLIQWLFVIILTLLRWVHKTSQQRSKLISLHNFNLSSWTTQRRGEPIRPHKQIPRLHERKDKEKFLVSSKERERDEKSMIPHFHKRIRLWLLVFTRGLLHLCLSMRDGYTYVKNLWFSLLSSKVTRSWSSRPFYKFSTDQDEPPTKGRTSRDDCYASPH